MDKRVVMSFGGGTNSTAMLVGLLEHKERLDAITFADTGAEKPHTYQHIETMTAWCFSHNLPPITVLRGPEWWQPKMVIDGSLEGECLRRGTLPSKAYGYAKCTMKWKVQPQIKWLNRYVAEQGVAPETVVRLIGFDADEVSRRDRMISGQGASRDKEPWTLRFPLFDWGWGREECIEAIHRAGLPQPGKSSCYFCPSSKKREILDLRDRYPDLFARALDIERLAASGQGEYGKVTTCAGLGRKFSWATFVRDIDREPLLPLCDVGQPEIDCGCYDGE